ncbi:MAG: hypothetical protein VX278_23510, partial [Myxococcota bacterium]|nr:hypothetical protein [Myxococcota bacterium]
MKKYLLAIALAQISCSPCRIKDLRPISSIAELSDSCDIPPNLSDAWSCSVPKPLDASVASLRELHDACKLEDWTDKDHFSLNDGDSLKALEHYYWFQKQGLLGVKYASKLFLGKRLLPKDTPLIEIRLRKEPHISDLSKLSTFTEEVTGGGVWGEYPNWHLPETNHNLIAIPDHFSIRTLRYALASRKVEDEPLKVLILSKDLTYVSVYPPKSEQAEVIAWDDEIYPKTDADFLRISISDERSILDLLSVITAFPTKKIELAMDKKPCEDPPKGMRCVAGVDELDTFYIDIEPRDVYAECKKSGICRSTKGSWLSAVEQCNFQGKHLPSLYEYKAAQVSDGNVQW